MEQFYKICIRNPNTPSKKLWDFLSKYIKINAGYPYQKNQEFCIRRQDIILMLIQGITLLYKPHQRVSLCCILLDYIFNENNLYHDILVYYATLATTIHDKLYGLMAECNGKYKKHFEEYLIEHHKQSQKILLF